MDFVYLSKDNGIATVTLKRGKVNALNEAVIDQIKSTLEDIENDHMIKAVVLTGQGKFFSFGFDVPEFLSYSKDEFGIFLTKFTTLYRYMFLFPKPIIAALNGHTVAGGCMIATSCDYRLMVSGKAKISLNEISFGSSVLAGSVEMLKFCVGSNQAETILYSGAMYSAAEASRLGLVDQVSAEDNLAEDAKTVAQDLAQKDNVAFRSIKKLLRKPVGEEMLKREKDSIDEFIGIWYSENTWQNLQGIKIHP